MSFSLAAKHISTILPGARQAALMTAIKPLQLLFLKCLENADATAVFSWQELMWLPYRAA